MDLTKTQKIISWILRIIAAVILLQTLYFKFSAHPDSLYIFEKTGLGDAGRIGSGIGELIAGILLLLPRTAWLGAALAIGTVSGAIFFHLTSLGVVVNDDGGLLFGMAIVVFICSTGVLWIHRHSIPFFNK